MLKIKKQQVNSLSSLKRTEEYKDLSNMAIVFACRYCFKHRKELTSKEDVKKCFDKAVSIFKARKQNKLIKEDMQDA